MNVRFRPTVFTAHNYLKPIAPKVRAQRGTVYRSGHNKSGLSLKTLAVPRPAKSHVRRPGESSFSMTNLVPRSGGKRRAKKSPGLFGLFGF